MLYLMFDWGWGDCSNGDCLTLGSGLWALFDWGLTVRLFDFSTVRLFDCSTLLDLKSEAKQAAEQRAASSDTMIQLPLEATYVVELPRNNLH